MHMKHLIVVAGAVMLAASGACNAPPSEPVEAAHVEMPATPAKIWGIINGGHKMAAE